MDFNVRNKKKKIHTNNLLFEYFGIGNTRNIHVKNSVELYHMLFTYYDNQLRIKFDSHILR